MVNSARIVMIGYGLLMLGGGLGGYKAAHSKPSLIAGIAAVVLLAIAYGVSANQPRAGLGLAFAVAIGLVVVFIRRYVETQKPMPSLMLLLLSAVVAAVFAVAFARAGK